MDKSFSWPLQVWAGGWLLMCGWMALWTPLARAELSSTPIASGYVTDGPVYAAVTANGITYIGGNFTHIGPYMGSAVPIDAATGAPLADFPKVNGTVYAIAADNSGGWYIGGAFTQVGGVARNRIAHILATGAVDPAWNPDANGSVFTLTTSGSTVYIGGAFTNIGGQRRDYIAALNAATGTATAWSPNASWTVHALTVSGSIIYVGGYFTGIGGKTRNRIAALDATTGAVMDWNPNADRSVQAIAVSGSTVYVGGEFTSVGGQSRNYLAALSAITGAATAWNPNANGLVEALVVRNSTVYTGGGFTSIGGATRNHLAALDVTTGLPTAWDPNANGWVGALAMNNSTIYAGGTFTSVAGQARKYVVALDDTTGFPSAWNPGAYSYVYAIAISGPTVYAGGTIGGIGGLARSHLAALDTLSGLPTAWNPSANETVMALAANGSTIYAGGNFTAIGGQSRNKIAALDAATSLPTAWNPNANGIVFAIAVNGPTVYVGGMFSNIGGQTRNYLAALDAATGSCITWNPNANNWVKTLLASGSTVYAGGYFTSIGGQIRPYLAALDAITGTATAWNPSPSSGVEALVMDGSTVFAGGQFHSIGGQTRKYLAALDATTGTATAWDSGANEWVEALAVSGSSVYAGGYFRSIGGQNRNQIAALDVATGTATAWNPNASEPIFALAVDNSTVYIGGQFTSIGGENRTNLAGFAITNANQAPTANAGSNQSVTTGNLVTLSGYGTDPDNSPSPLKYQWTQTAGPTVVLSAANVAKPTFTPTTYGTYTFSLVVNDGAASSPASSVTITVNAPPVANAGAAQSVNAGTLVTLDGSASSDPDNGPSPLTYRWSQTSGPTVTLFSTIGERNSFTPTASGTYVFSLVVNDGKWDSPASSVTIKVNALPVASAGSVQSVTTGNLVTLSGSGTDPDNGPNLLKYQWTQTAGPTVALSAANVAKPSFTPTVPGTYTFSLVVNDGAASSPASTVTITATQAATNQAPTANAGSNQSVTTGNLVTLSGSGTDPDNGPQPLTYAWIQVSGPTVTLNAANTAQASFTPSQPGDYVFKLTVSDGAASASSTVTVTATSSNTATPLLSAGTGSFQNRWKASVFLGINNNTDYTIEPVGDGYVRIKEMSSDKYLNIEAYTLQSTPILSGWWSAQWKPVSGDSGYFFLQNKWIPDRYINIENGSLQAGTIKSDWLSAQWKFVPATPNQAPTANPGSNQTVTTSTPVTLDGRASTDPDNGPKPLAYAWTQISGPTVTLTAANAAQASFTPSQPGDYVFKLTVSDGAASASSTVTVTARNPTQTTASADLALRLTADVNGKGSGYQINYTAIVHNNGPSPATNVKIILSDTNSTPYHPLDTDRLEVGEDYQGPFQANDSPLRPLVATATVSADQPDPKPTNNTAKISIAFATTLPENGSYTFTPEDFGFSAADASTPAQLGTLTSGAALFDTLKQRLLSHLADPYGVWMNRHAPGPARCGAPCTSLLGPGIKIVSLPVEGRLKLPDGPVTIYTDIPLDKIRDRLLTYDGPRKITGAWLQQFLLQKITAKACSATITYILTLTPADESVQKTGDDKINKLAGTAKSDLLRGGGDNDRLDGKGGNDRLFGEAGNDTLMGGSGADDLSGGDGADKLYGQSGEDILIGGPGDDTLDGGGGKDQYHYLANQLRTGDLAPGKDRIVATPGDAVVFNLNVWADFKLKDGSLDDQRSQRLPKQISAGNFLAFNDKSLLIDLNRDGTYKEKEDLTITVTGPIKTVTVGPSGQLLMN